MFSISSSILLLCSAAIVSMEQLILANRQNEILFQFKIDAKQYKVENFVDKRNLKTAELIPAIAIHDYNEILQWKQTAGPGGQVEFVENKFNFKNHNRRYRITAYVEYFMEEDSSLPHSFLINSESGQKSACVYSFYEFSLTDNCKITENSKRFHLFNATRPEILYKIIVMQMDLFLSDISSIMLRFVFGGYVLPETTFFSLTTPTNIETSMGMDIAPNYTVIDTTNSTIETTEETIVNVDKINKNLLFALIPFMILSLVLGYIITNCLLSKCQADNKDTKTDSAHVENNNTLLTSCEPTTSIEMVDNETSFEYVDSEIVYERDWLSEITAASPSPVELMREHITITKELGHGSFGTVSKGLLYPDSKKYRPSKEVAIKEILKNDAENEYARMCLKIELKILSYIGHHENVLKLIGVIKQPVSQLMIVTEFCSLGDLRSYIEKKKKSSSSFPLNLTLSQILSPNNKLCSTALMMYAMQIANGADYLSTNKTLIHRDLALRNVLLTSEHIVKIGDFGLAVKGTTYTVNKRNRLPIRWLSPESLNHESQMFTHQSDVWSFAVLLWELFTLGDDPNSVMAPTDQHLFRDWLMSGNRFPPPNSIYRAEKAYQIMEDCWNKDPDLRPSFHECRKFFHRELINLNSAVIDYLELKITIENH